MDERTETGASAIGGVVFGLIVAALGVFFVFVLLGGAKKAKETRGWEETACEITRSEINQERPTPNHRAIPARMRCLRVRSMRARLRRRLPRTWGS